MMMMPHIIVPSDETVLLPNVFEKFVSSPVTMHIASISQPMNTDDLTSIRKRSVRFFMMLSVSKIGLPFIMLFIICSTVMSPNMPPCPAASDIMLSSPDRSIESSCPSIIVW